MSRQPRDVARGSALASAAREWAPAASPDGATAEAAGGAPAEARRLLEQAGARTIAQWEHAPDHRLPAAEVRTYVELLVREIERASSDQAPAVDPIPPAIPARRLLESVRAQLVDLLASAPEGVAAAGLKLLRALESVQRTIDEDCAHRFANRLNESDALDLIVEVAHDMRSPLGSILFLVETLRNARSGPVTPIQERQLGIVYNAAFGLSSLASDVIDLARGCDRLMDQRPLPFSVVEILQSVRDIVRPIAEEKGLTLNVVTPAADFRVGHAAALNRVLLNLTTNALKFTSEGSVDVAVRPTSRTRLEFSVQDTGRGIPPEVMATLFDAFRGRQKRGQYTFSSAGLGLAICRKLISSMKGELKVEAGAPRGTRFSFELDLPLAAKM